MTLEERIEAAAKSVAPAEYLWRDWVKEAEAALKAAFPELFSEPPSAWLAPWEAGEELTAAGAATPGMRMVDGGLVLAAVHGWAPEPPKVSPLAQAFAAIRDAHLNPDRSEGEAS